MTEESFTIQDQKLAMSSRLLFKMVTVKHKRSDYP